MALYGGAIGVPRNNSGYIQLNKCLFDNNTALMYGGSVYSFNSIVSLKKTIIMNSEGLIGGGLYYFNKEPYIIVENNNRESIHNITERKKYIYGNKGNLFGDDVGNKLYKIKIIDSFSEEGKRITMINETYGVIKNFRSGE